MKKIILGLFTLSTLLVFGQEDHDPDTYFNQAKLSYKMRKLDRSIEQCNEALKIDSMHYEALLLKGMCFYDMEKYNDAINWASKSILAYNRNDEAFFEAGCRLIKRGVGGRCLLRLPL